MKRTLAALWMSFIVISFFSLLTIILLNIFGGYGLLILIGFIITIWAACELAKEE